MSLRSIYQVLGFVIIPLWIMSVAAHAQSPVVLESPADSATLPSLQPTVILRWHPVAPIAFYRVQLARLPNFDLMEFDTIIASGTTATFSHAIEGPHFCRIAVHDASGDTDWSTIWNFTIGSLGVFPIPGDFMKVSAIYPNPARGEIAFTMDQSTFGAIPIVVRDALGNVVLSLPALKPEYGSCCRINASSLAEGCYYLELASAAGILRRRFLIAK